MGKNRYRKRLIAGLMGILMTTTAAAQQGTYEPRYWTEGAFDHLPSNDAAIRQQMSVIQDQGWGGILYWGASYEGDKMHYYYPSPFLKKQPWALQGKDGLSSLVKAAHDKGIKVMVNMEGVNPYHWQQHHWTPANIRLAAEDLAAAGTDAVFEECFEASPAVFSSLASSLRERKVDYISGTDPMLLREGYFASLWPQTSIINIYNYYLKRDKLFNIATLTQHGSLGYGWAKYWGKPTAMISPVNRNWGIAGEYSPAVIAYLCMIRALQFRLDHFIVFGGEGTFDPVQNKEWIKYYTDRQEKDRPLLNVVVLLDKKGSQAAWNRLFNSGDAITSGAFNGGYNVVVSDKVLPADAYWIYASGGNKDTLPATVVNLFQSNKPVFLQAAATIPGGQGIQQGWKTALKQCGVDASALFRYCPGTDAPAMVSLPESQDTEIPYTGYYDNTYLRFTGTDAQRGTDLRAGTIIPATAINGKVLSSPNSTYGKGPYIIGKDNKYLVTATALNWEAAYPISHLLSGAGIHPSSNVWGIVGKKVTALLAIEATELNVTIPGLKDGEKIQVVIWDNKQQKRYEETLVYHAPYRQMLREYDLIMINKAD
ncbi:alpha-amylase family protein [Chitinophaga qingshengii]|uniref:Beta-galactosidase trimerisation domain-containing protein n=1 Tax=Chitinophaga qingshengii TaxID=1569794 RepID=A0ABR7TQM8_9BACT|nr:alpha-amylase family protein [Chitinophaga qingshengii]MBC9932797.1 hypothetical protein [Chitinophaga qingshengii]